MKRTLISLAALALALPGFAQQPAAAASVDPQKKVVASINGEVITLEKLNQLYDRLGTQMRDQYEQNGGKTVFLQNYIGKRLLVQEALKSGFDKRPDVQADMEASRESTLFDRYVRDVVSAPIVTDAELHTYYNTHPDQFATPERIKVRHIVIVANGAGPRPKTDAQATEAIQRVLAELHQKNQFPTADAATAQRLALEHFAIAARQYSEDGSAQQGGDLGWVERGKLDPDFEEAAWGLKPGATSGVIHTRFGYHIIMNEAKKPAGTVPFEEAKNGIREFMMTQKAADVMQTVGKLTNELRGSSKISVYPENIQ
jgi:peptidyl-prolyl cis-trans isomerase C